MIYGLPSSVIAGHDMPEHDTSHSKPILNSSHEHHQANKDEVHTLDEIVVTAEKIEEYIQNHPQNVVSIDSGEIRKRNF